MRINTAKKIIKNINSALEKKRLELSVKEQHLDMLQDDLSQILKQISHEINIIESSSELIFGFGEFFGPANDKQKNLNTEIIQANQSIEHLREELRDILSEKKRYEYVMNNRIKLLGLKEIKLENNILDEIVITKHVNH